jgi:hypothetical protein
MKKAMDTNKKVVLICPCCASPVDAQVGHGQQSLQCDACDQQWTMVIDPSRIAEYALT